MLSFSQGDGKFFRDDAKEPLVHICDFSDFADFSKAFDTVDYSVVIRKLHSIGFSNEALQWTL